MPAPTSDNKSKEFGASKPEKEENENESDAEAGTNDTFVAEKTDERFHEQPGMSFGIPSPLAGTNNHSSQLSVETGEEHETTRFSVKGKLYYFDQKWKERGSGTFKVNTKTESDGKTSGRMIMRVDGALRVTLNSALFRDMAFGDRSHQRPTSKEIFLATQEEDGKLGLLLLRVSLL